MTVAHHVTGIFSDPKSAERAVQDLIDSHFSPEEISIVVADRQGEHAEPIEHDTGIAEGAGAGAALGGALGALGATLVATGVIVIEPAVALFATGPLLAALKGAAAGGAVGLEVGALAGLGFWKDEAHIHAEALKQGGVVVAVPAEHAHAEHARKVFAEAEADEVRG
jgi:hypothetical protein